MENKNDVDASILYDLTVCIEWPHEVELNKLKEKTRQVLVSHLWTIGERAFLGLLQAAGLYSSTTLPYWVPNSLLRHVASHLNWHLAIAEGGKLLAVLQNQSIEICSLENDVAESLGRWPITKDSCPQMRRIVWSLEGDYLAYADSLGNVTIYDLIGTVHCHLPSGYGIVSNLLQDLSYAMCSLVFKDAKKKSDGSIELLAINYRGFLKAYDISSTGEVLSSHSFDFSAYHPEGVTAVAYHPTHAMLVIGGPSESTRRKAGSSALDHGISAWRLLADTPHYKLIDFDDDALSRKNKFGFMRQMRMRLPWPHRAKQSNSYLRLSVSPDGKHLASLDSFGQLTVYTMPSLRVLYCWPHGDQPGHAAVNPAREAKSRKRKKPVAVPGVLDDSLVIGVEWWSPAELIVSRANGAVSVCSMETLNNLLGPSPEWFEPVPIINGAYASSFQILECECKIRSSLHQHKRISAEPSDDDTVPSDDEAGDSDDDADEGGLMKRCANKAKELIYYTLDMESPALQRKAMRQLVRKYSIVQLKQITAQELYARRIDNGEYGEALTLANVYSLDADLVYQRQWRNSPVTIASIHDYLSKISKRAWVLHECMERVSDNVDAMRELLQYGLRGTELEVLVAIGKHTDTGKFMVPDDLVEDEGIDDDAETTADEADISVKEKMRRDELLKEIDPTRLTVVQTNLIRTRLKLLQYLDRLQTYEEILGGIHVAAERYDASFFRSFRSQNIVEVTTDYAKAGDWKAVDILFTYHSGELLPHWLAILSSIPETYAPFEYRTLLPEVGSRADDPEVLEWETDAWRDDDWCLQFLPELDLVSSDSGEYFYEENPALTAFRGYPLDKRRVTDWYDYRAHEIEALSRHVDHSLELIRLAIERHVEGLDVLYDDLVTMETMVYECNVEESFTLRHLQQMPDIDRLRLMMSKSSDEMYVKNIHRWLVPFLQQQERQERGSADALLHDYMVTMARDDLYRCRLICECSQAKVAAPVIQSQMQLMSLALECVYACRSDDQLPHATAILECLPERDNTETGQLASVHDRVDALQDHLSVSEMLAKYDVHVPVKDIGDKQHDAEEVKKIYVKVTRMASKKEPMLTEKKWLELLSDLVKARDKVFTCIDKSTCIEIVVEGLLCSSNFHCIQLAGSLMHCTSSGHTSSSSVSVSRPQLAYDKSVQLILAASREYFNSAIVIADASMDFARLCLALITDSNREIQEELDLIDSLVLLEGFGVNMLPLQIRMSQDRMQIIVKALEAKPNAYKNVPRLLKLGHQLRVAGSSSNKKHEEEGRVLRLVAQAAIKAKDVRVATETCQQLMTLGYGAAWPECRTVADMDVRDVTLKSKLLSFALCFCSPEVLPQIMHARNALEIQVLSEHVSHAMSPERQLSPEQDAAASISAKSVVTADAPPSSIATETASKRQSVEGQSQLLTAQAKTVLASTGKATRAVLSHIGDTAWWKKTLSKLQSDDQLLFGYGGDSGGRGNVNAGLEFQACHPFYEDIMPSLYIDQNAVDYSDLSDAYEATIQFESKVLRLAALENTCRDSAAQHNYDGVLRQLAQLYLSRDTTAGLGYVLAMEKLEAVEALFKELPKTSLTMLLQAYYYALQVARAVLPDAFKNIPAVDVERTVYRWSPDVLIARVLNSLDKGQVKVEESQRRCVEKLRDCTRELMDHVLMERLKSLAPSTDVTRFSTDSKYRTETVLGLALSDDEPTFQLTLDLARRYDIQLFDVYSTHLICLFDSGMLLSDIEARIAKRQLLPVLTAKPAEFYSQMQANVYPLLSGSDHDILASYFRLFDSCDVADAKNHIKLLKMVSSCLPGVDYKRLVSGVDDPVDLLKPHLTTSNISTVAKLASKIPTKDGFLQASTVHCAWAVQQFWNGRKKQSQSDDHWAHYFESVSESLNKLSPADYLAFIEKILFSNDAVAELTVSNRLRILQSASQYCEEQVRRSGKSTSGMTWQEVGGRLTHIRSHLEMLSHPAIVRMRDDPATADYVTLLDKSQSKQAELLHVVHQLVVDGQTPQVIDDVLSAVNNDDWSAVTAYQQVLDKIFAALRHKEDGKQPEYTLFTLSTIIDVVRAHVEDGGLLVTLDDLRPQLLDYCSQSFLASDVRLEIMRLIEQAQTLSEDDQALVIFWKTEILLSAVKWNKTVSEEEVSSEESRVQLFNELLAQCTDMSHVSCLSEVLKAWPRFEQKRKPEQDPWCQLLSHMLNKYGHDATFKALTIIHELSFNDKISDESLNHIHIMFIKLGSPTDAAKCLLFSHKQTLYDKAAAILNMADESCDDTELFSQLLERHLLASVVTSPFYPRLVSYILDCQATADVDDQPSHLRIEVLSSQLTAAGFHAEAKALVTQYQRMYPQHARSGDNTFSKLTSWFKR